MTDPPRDVLPPAGAFPEVPHPRIEILSRPPGPPTVELPLKHSTRFRVFALVFLVVLAAGSLWNFTRPPVYRAVATVLVEVPEGIGFRAGTAGADAQNVAVQERILLARDLLADTLDTAARSGATVAGLDPDTLGRMLYVRPTPETNLVELGATGSDPNRLAQLVNAWTDAYLARRQRQVQSDVDATLTRLQEEYERLDAARREKASALDAYRAENDIDTMERDGNQALARLAALTEELNKARGEQTKAEAERDALEQAIARGEPVVPKSEQGSVEQLQAEAAKLRARLGALEQRYTRVYLDNEPTLRELPSQLAGLEARIADKLKEGRDFMRSSVARDIERARRQASVVEQKLAVARSEASRFTAKYARYETMKKDLEQVDELRRKLEERLVDVRAKAPERYAQIKVVDPAYPPDRAFAPPYGRDFLVTLAGAGGAALLSVLLLEFLSRRARQPEEMLPVTGVRVFESATSGAGLAARPVASGQARVAGQQGPTGISSGELGALPGPSRRELLVGEVRALCALADPASRQLVGLLMSGLTWDECARLGSEHLDLDAGTVQVPGAGRPIALGRGLVAWLAEHRPVPLWCGASGPASLEELGARIRLLAHDAGLAHPAEVDVDALRHTYLCFLVRQGVRLTELERVVGPMPTAELARYGVLSPSGPGKPLAAIDPIYPGLEGAA